MVLIRVLTESICIPRTVVASVKQLCPHCVGHLYILVSKGQ